ncbi:bifunctional tRNA (5-methylaminomethyl-2-thiouridine)(34)-methyltransferase MnmD/FAD-dependent 5-carboxymethylaminomethyl-2-thiouridine(34) oxidoreductase MnmC [Idiomarina sp. 29L]|uniref:bifunctional tRNA (5-methylaminomethyl-2-thiouridine)(34)-methyltransferase MnmD/FAD-dependent 5-carboxymethylaminomethyl-2-thiouridine(34) oxidoreductase MnmC n=1 Tax=Idiomarina sp. 29L TaxID=2508877 RepID=UPI001011A86A|nr:bifunctional tRNA (5-methylaminomethyl-2-thiouridine)(34)-methyltransferase MnmD/FAD-dependent 5-carboxymethylaminomethyl-2-thiouridine(34) oxidoreductase MnmC [Idiomarina sp. 29L]RXS44048.1 bifunctional tRNA (5-methylaminomethyl-2-thiouridine)(34)-methyltransferase MnmD/FAD-dependent 5-carboxymethylaminomethyl-2-thiouridine(34) oxidoreductase MnmC [Idiomarina sp. 29L]
MNSKASVKFNEYGVPVSTTFDDIYFSIESGIDESQYVFLKHNGLPERWQNLKKQECFTVAETGFGTGLNFLLAWQQFLEHAPTNGRLHFISFEKFPLTKEQLQQAYALLPDVKKVSSILLEHYPSPEAGCHRLTFAGGRVTLDLWIGDVNELFPQWQPQAKHKVDAWFLDGFAPSKNPDMWQRQLFETMAVTAHEGTTYATFTAAGVVRRGLNDAGFAVNKVSGYGRKREMVCGQYQGQAVKLETQSVDPQTDSVVIIGGGISAACCALSLHKRGVTTKVISPSLADGASGNPQGAVYPLLHAEHTPLSRFYWQAFSTALNTYRQYVPGHWQASGVLQPAFNEQREQRFQKVASDLYNETTVRYLNAEDTNKTAGITIDTPALFYPQAGWLKPEPVVKSLFRQAGSEIVNHNVQSISRAAEGGWRISLSNGESIQAKRVVLATGHNFNELLPADVEPLPIKPVRGQITQVKTTKSLAPLKTVLCYKGYLVPESESIHCLGATFTRGETDLETRLEDNEENLKQLNDNAKQPWAKELDVHTQRASVRATTPDHQPVVGQLCSGLYGITGLGSRGFTSAPLLGEILAGLIGNDTLPLTDDALARLSPARFHR